jgi:two-component system, chemotaxis family, chemotaxis protein CheY
MNKTVLIVDDSPTLRRLVRYSVNRVYRNLNYLEAGDGAEALDFLRSGIGVDVIVLDINMPRMDGISFLKEKVKTAAWKDIPTVILTSSREENMSLAAMDYGVVAYLPKPFNVSRMKEILIKLLEDTKP